MSVEVFWNRIYLLGHEEMSVLQMCKSYTCPSSRFFCERDANVLLGHVKECVLEKCLSCRILVECHLKIGSTVIFKIRGEKSECLENLKDANVNMLFCIASFFILNPKMGLDPPLCSLSFLDPGFTQRGP